MFWRLRDLRVYNHVAIGVTALGLILADSVVVAARGNDSSPPPALPMPHVSPRLGMLPGVIVESVASGHRRIWALVERPSASRDRYFVDGIDPASNRVTARIRLPGPASYVFYGARHVWVSGVGDGGVSNPTISAIDPSTRQVEHLRLGKDAAVSSIAFHGKLAYAAVAGRDQVLAIGAGKRLRVRRIAERGGPLAVVAVRGAIEVTNEVRNLVPIILPGADTSFLAEVSRLRPVFARAGRRSVWVRGADGVIRVDVSSGGVRSRKHVRAGGRVLAMVVTPGGGCYLAVTHAHRHSTPNIVYFSRSALRARDPRPTAVHRGRSVNHLALDPAGGVVYADASGKLWRWIPRPTSLR